MRDIKMRYGYQIINKPTLKNEDCILVKNYDGKNEIVNISWELKDLESIKGLFSIGIWKLKNSK